MQVAADGRIVVASLHQPSPEMFFRLDKVLLMAKGHRIYLGAPQGASDFFQRHGVPLPQGRAIAEHMLQVRWPAPPCPPRPTPGLGFLPAPQFAAAVGPRSERGHAPCVIPPAICHPSTPRSLDF